MWGCSSHRAVVEDQVVDAADGHARCLPMREQGKALRQSVLPVHLGRLIPAAHSSIRFDKSILSIWIGAGPIPT